MFTKKRITIASVAAATVTGLALTATSAGAQEPPITVSPLEAAPGESFSVSGPPCDALLEPTSIAVNLEGTRASTSTSDEDQPWSVTLTVPEGTPPGEYVVIAQCFDATGLFTDDLGRVPFTVTEPTPPTTTTTSTTIPDETTTTAPGEPTTTLPGTPPTSDPGDDDNGTAGGPDEGAPTDPDEGTTSAAGDSATIPDGPETEPSEPAPPVNGEPTFTG